MSTVATVVAKFEADTKDLQAGAARVNSSLRSVDDGVKKSAMSMNALKAGFIGVGAAAGMMALKVGIDAVRAAADEEKAVMRLSTALDNVNQGFRLGEVENFVDDLQRATGVADDDLRPALQALVTATGSVTKAQDLLSVAMDISAGTGRDLTSVSTALAKASNGQFTQINRLTNGAINPAVLATKDMTVVTSELNRLFGGQAQANAETFAGKLDRLKIAYDELLEAFGTGFIEGITSGSDAMTDAGNAFRAAEPGMQEFGRTLGEVGRIISYVSPFFDDLVNLFKFAIPTALGTAAAAFPPLIPLVSYIGTTFLGSKAHVDAFAESVDIIGVKFTGPMSRAAQIATTGIAGVGDAAEEAADEITVMRQEFDAWVGSLNAISAVDKAAESIDNIGKASVEFGTNLMGQTPKARDFRAEVISAFQDSAKAAQSLSDDLPTQRAIFTGELIKIVAALRASGVKPRDIEAFLGAMEGLPTSVADIMRQAAKQIGDTDFKTEVEKAFEKSVKAGAPMTADTMEQLAKGASDAAKQELGLTLEPQLASVIKSGTTALRPTAFLNGQLTGKSIGSGMANGIQETSPLVQAAVARVVAQAKAAADAAAQARSPSLLFAELGADLVAGIVLGVTRSTGVGVAAMGVAARAFTRAFMNEFFPKNMGQAESAIATAIANADRKLADAREALKQANREVRDAEKALNQARRESTNAAKEQERAERRLAKAQEALKNAEDADARKAAKQAVKQAEDELARARQNANRAARDLTTAEGVLARARREATAAADAAKLAAWVEANRKALGELQKIAATFDKIKEKTAVAQEGFTALAQLVATPFGQPSDISKMFGSDASIDNVINGFFKIRDSVKQAYAVLTDASIVGADAAKRNRAEMNATIKELEDLTAQAVQLREQHAAVMEQLKTLEEDYQKDVAETNAFYDAAEKAAEENIKAIEDRWAAAIPILEEALKSANEAYEKENATLKKLIDDRDQFVGSIKSGFRSFVNSLSFESRAATKQIVKETKRLADGVTVTLERELEVGGGPSAIRETLQQRLESVREFSRNIRTLMQRGLDPTLVRDFVSAGVDGAGAAAAALASGSQDDIAAINTVQSQLLSEAEDFGAYASAQWHDIGIAQQQAIVAPLEIARDAAQKALDDANALREQELATARAHLDKLRADRQAALAVLESEYLAKKGELEAQAAALTAQMDAVAAQIEDKIAEMVSKTALASAQAGQQAAQKLLDEFKKKYPALYRELNGLMTQLANSMNRTATVFVQTVFDTAVPVQTTVRRTSNQGKSLTTQATTTVPASTPDMGRRAMVQGGGNTYQITVNAGVGDPREIGRVTVDAITAYERSSGRVFARA